MPEGASTSTCTVDDCGRPAQKAQLCWGHYKRAQLGKPVHVQLEKHHRTPLAALLDSSMKFAEAEEDDDYERAVMLLALYARRYVKFVNAQKVRSALKKAKARGEQVGRPMKPVADGELELIRLGERRVKDVAAALGVSRRTVQRALRRATKTPVLSHLPLRRPPTP